MILMGPASARDEVGETVCFGGILLFGTNKQCESEILRTFR